MTDQPTEEWRVRIENRHEVCSTGVMIFSGVNAEYRAHTYAKVVTRRGVTALVYCSEPVEPNPRSIPDDFLSYKIGLPILPIAYARHLTSKRLLKGASS